MPQGEVLGQFELLDPDGLVHASCRGGFAWLGKRPRQVTVVWPDEGNARTASVPVIDRYGRYCAAHLPAARLGRSMDTARQFPDAT